MARDIRNHTAKETDSTEESEQVTKQKIPATTSWWWGRHGAGVGWVGGWNLNQELLQCII